jgi:hypothetical protein
MRWLKHALVLLAMLAGPAGAHMTVAQKGTLNVAQGGAYLMVSLPVAAFAGVDVDGDGLLSVQELRDHAPAIRAALASGLQLLARGRPLPFEPLLLDTVHPDDRPGAPADQLLLMGRFALPAGMRSVQAAGLRLQVGLFGTRPEERRLELTVTGEGHTQALAFTPQTPVRTLFASPASLVWEQMQSGVLHVLAGADHLLFLLVVLADALGARVGWRRAPVLLSAFTLGHGLTLAATTLGGLSLSPAWVEPAIAASIVAMAGFSLWQWRLGQHFGAAVQVVLVFGCALVHGLGFGSALLDQGWTGRELLWAVAGFNLGIEAAQLAVALVAAVAMALVRRLAGASTPFTLARGGSLVAAAIGAAWWIERVQTLA